MRQRIAALGLAVLVLAMVSLCSQGTALTGSAFELGASARALGLGGAFTALVDDETATVHNPAALGSLTGIGFSSLYVRQWSGITYGSITLAMPWVGLNLSLLDSGLIASQQGAFRYASQAITVSGGVPIGPASVGVRWRYVRTSAPISGAGWTLDPAFRLDFDSVKLAAIFESALSQPMVYASGSEESFEPSLRVGVAATLTPSPDVWWNAAFEVAGVFASNLQFGAGLEAWMGGLGARVGYDGVGPTFGLTFRLSGLQVDWAYAMRADLGGSHRVSLSLRF